MTRGRKKDLTIPPTRALVQQRDYRARKAQYVSELEERCRRAEEENAQLRKDLASARAGLAIPAAAFNPELAQSSAELMQHLALTSASLARFQQMAFAANTLPPPHPTQNSPPPSSSASMSPETYNAPRLTPFPSPAPSSSYSEPLSTPPMHSRSEYSRPLPSLNPGIPPPQASSPHRHLQLRHLHTYHPPPRPDSPPGKRYFRSSDSLSPPRESPNPARQSRSSSIASSSECCGGILDCRDLVIDRGMSPHHSGSETALPSIGTTTLPRLSELRSTTDDDDPAAQFYSRRAGVSTMR